MPSWLSRLLTTDGFVPHGHCYRWQPGLVWLHASSDLSIGLACLALSLTLAYLVGRPRALPFRWGYVAFGAFLVTCGLTHLMSVWTLWTPLCWLDGVIKAAAALASVSTALMLAPLVPGAVALAGSARLAHTRGLDLEEANRKLAELHEKSRQLEQLKTTLFTDVSHELRTPLSIMLGTVERRLGSPSLPGDLRDDLEAIRRNGKGLLRHLNDLLDVTRLASVEARPDYASIDAAALVRSTAEEFRSLAHQHGVRLVVDVGDDEIEAELDVDKTRRILLNLVANALSFAPEGGVARVSARQADERLVIEVADSGPGVAPEHRTSVFERFTQIDGAARRGTGSGLGLAIVKQLVELHGGTIEIGEAPEGGALFSVALPLRAPEGATVQPAPSQSRAPPSPSTLLAARPASPALPPGAPTVVVAEDNPELASLIADTIGNQYHVVLMRDGASALACVEQQTPDLLITDLMMPGITGEALVRAVRERPELDALPIVVLSAWSDDDQRVRLLREGAQDYLLKPFSAEELRARVDNLVSLKTAVDVLRNELETRRHDVGHLAHELASRKRELEQALATAERARGAAEQANRTKDEFLGLLSHELRTPLNAVLGWTHMMKSGVLDEQGRGKAVEVIDRNAHLLFRLIRDLLDASRIVAGKLAVELSPVDLGQVVKQAVEDALPSAARGRVSVELSLPDQAVKTQGDRDRLVQAVGNLVANGVKFTPAGGRVRVELTLRPAGHAVLSVSDTGKGISPAFLPHVFDRFRQEDTSERRAEGGLGLGLTITRFLVEAHGGSIRAESPGPGQGATFVVELPAMAG